MSKHAKIVLWLGLAMITIQVVLDWPQIRQVLFTSPPVSSGSGKRGTNTLGEPTGIPGIPRNWPVRNGLPDIVKGKCPPGWFPNPAGGGQCSYPVGF